MQMTSTERRSRVQSQLNTFSHALVFMSMSVCFVLFWHCNFLLLLWITLLSILTRSWPQILRFYSGNYTETFYFFKLFQVKKKVKSEK
jgi:hypothetical protein